MPRPDISLTYHARHHLIEQVGTCYHQASLAQRTLLLDTVVAMTGYARKYVIRLLNEANEASEGKRIIQRRRVPRYGPEIQQALVVTWKAARHICTKRLIPFLPTLVPALERQSRNGKDEIDRPSQRWLAQEKRT